MKNSKVNDDLIKGFIIFLEKKLSININDNLSDDKINLISQELSSDEIFNEYYNYLVAENRQLKIDKIFNI